MRARDALRAASGILLAAGGTGTVTTQDLSLGITTESVYAWALPGSDIGDSGRLDLEPLLSASGDIGSTGEAAWEINARARLTAKTQPESATASLDRAGVRLWLGPLTLEALYGTDPSPAAEIFPLLSFFGPADPLSPLQSGGNRSDRACELLAKAALTLGFLRASLTFAPFPPPLQLPELDSPWSPPDTFQGEIVIFNETYAFTGATYAEPDPAPGLDPAWETMLGASLGSLDLGLHWFRGLGRTAAFSSVLEAVWPRYSVLLSPEWTHLDILGLFATATAGSFQAWMEGSWTPDCPLQTSSVLLNGLFMVDSDQGTMTDLEPIIFRDRLAATLGASWSPRTAGPSLRIFTEGTWTQFTGAPSESRPPALSRALALGLDIGGIAGMDLGLFGLLSLADGSGAVRFSLGLPLGAEGSLGISLPLAFGAVASELGKYRDHRSLLLVLKTGF